MTLTHLPFFLVRGSQPGKNGQLSEVEIRGLCLKAREIFLIQPILLELETPMKICGEKIVKECHNLVAKFNDKFQMTKLILGLVNLFYSHYNR